MKVSQTSLFSEAVDALMARQVRFEYGGRGPDEYDCVGVFLELIRRAFGIDLPDPFDDLNVASVKKFAELFDDLDGYDDLQTGDVLHLSKRSVASAAHIVVVESRFLVVDIIVGAGVVRDRLGTVLEARPTAHRLKALNQ